MHGTCCTGLVLTPSGLLTRLNPLVNVQVCQTPQIFSSTWWRSNDLFVVEEDPLVFTLCGARNASLGLTDRSDIVSGMDRRPLVRNERLETVFRWERCASSGIGSSGSGSGRSSGFFPLIVRVTEKPFYSSFSVAILRLVPALTVHSHSLFLEAPSSPEL